MLYTYIYICMKSMHVCRCGCMSARVGFFCRCIYRYLHYMLYIYICALRYTILYDMICVGMATCLSGSFATSCFRQQGGTSRVIITLQALKRPRFYDKERLKTNNGPKTYRGRIYWTCPIWSVSYPPNWSGPKYWSQMRSRYECTCR